MLNKTVLGKILVILFVGAEHLVVLESYLARHISVGLGVGFSATGCSYRAGIEIIAALLNLFRPQSSDVSSSTRWINCSTLAGPQSRWLAHGTRHWPPQVRRSYRWQIMIFTGMSMVFRDLN
jgi:hypothetical protein